MIDLRREVFAGRRADRTSEDGWRTLQRFASAVWFSVAGVAIAVLTVSDALEPGTRLRLVIAAAYSVFAGVVTRLLPRRGLLYGDLALRTVGYGILFLNVARNLTNDHWLLCLPMFLSGIIIPALFYRAIPLSIVAGEVTLAAAVLAAGANGPPVVRALAWGMFMWIMVLIIVVIQRLATERRLTMDQLRALAETDSLTALANRRHFMVAAAELLETAHAEHRPCTLILFDIDHFKSVNDLYGHDVGDQVLVGVARGIRDVCRTDDLIARLGGEEFAILMLGASVLHAQHTAAELAAQLGDITPVGVTASYGVVEAKVGELEIGELLVRADVALYQAKRAGRNRCVVEA